MPKPRKEKPRKQAAVAVILTLDEQGVVHMLFNIRATPYQTKGIYCFPGGGQDEGEEYPDTALRETMEENNHDEIRDEAGVWQPRENMLLPEDIIPLPYSLNPSHSVYGHQVGIQMYLLAPEKFKQLWPNEEVAEIFTLPAAHFLPTHLFPDDEIAFDITRYDVRTFHDGPLHELRSLFFDIEGMREQSPLRIFNTDLPDDHRHITDWAIATRRMHDLLHFSPHLDDYEDAQPTQMRNYIAGVTALSAALVAKTLQPAIDRGQAYETIEQLKTAIETRYHTYPPTPPGLYSLEEMDVLWGGMYRDTTGYTNVEEFYTHATNMGRSFQQLQWLGVQNLRKSTPLERAVTANQLLIHSYFSITAKYGPEAPYHFLDAVHSIEQFMHIYPLKNNGDGVSVHNIIGDFNARLQLKQAEALYQILHASPEHYTLLDAVYNASTQADGYIHAYEEKGYKKRSDQWSAVTTLKQQQPIMEAISARLKAAEILAEYPHKGGIELPVLFGLDVVGSLRKLRDKGEYSGQTLQKMDADKLKEIPRFSSEHSVVLNDEFNLLNSYIAGADILLNSRRHLTAALNGYSLEMMHQPGMQEPDPRKHIFVREHFSKPLKFSDGQYQVPYTDIHSITPYSLYQAMTPLSEQEPPGRSLLPRWPEQSRRGSGRY